MKHYSSYIFTAVGWMITIVFLISCFPANNKEWKSLLSVKYVVFIFMFVVTIYTLRDVVMLLYK